MECGVAWLHRLQCHGIIEKRVKTKEKTRVLDSAWCSKMQRKRKIQVLLILKSANDVS